MSQPTTTSGTVFPCLVIRLMREVYAVRQLPNDLHIDVLIAFATSARDACKELQMCLVLAPDRALYLHPDGSSEWSKRLPRPGEFVQFRPKALEFLPGVGPAPEESPRPAAPPAAVTPRPRAPTMLIDPVVPYVATVRPLATGEPAREPLDARAQLGVMRWIILVGVVGRIVLAHF